MNGLPPAANGSSTPIGQASPDDGNPEDDELDMGDEVVSTLQAAIAADKAGDRTKADGLYDAGLEELSIALHAREQRLKAAVNKLVATKLTNIKEALEGRLRISDTVSRQTWVARLESLLNAPDAAASEESALLGREPLHTAENPLENRDSWRAEVLLEVPNTARYLISAGGCTVETMDCNTAQVCRLLPLASLTAIKRLTTEAFIIMGDWSYPLVMGTTVLYHPQFGAYLFPNADVNNGSTVALVLPDAKLRAVFMELLRQLELLPVSLEQSSELMSDAPTAEVPRKRNARSSLAHKVISASEWVAATLKHGASIGGELLHRQGEALRAKLSPHVGAVAVNPVAAAGMNAMRHASHAVLTVSGIFVSALANAASDLSRRLAPYIFARAQQLLSSGVKSVFEQPRPTDEWRVDEIAQVAVSGLRGACVIYHSLNQAARALARVLTAETVRTVEHVYGADTARLAENMLYTVGNVAMVTSELRHIGVKAVAAQILKDTSVALAKAAERQRQEGASTV